MGFRQMVITTVIEFLVKGPEHFGFFDEPILLLFAICQHISRIGGINEFGFKVYKMFCGLQRENQCGRISLQSDLLGILNQSKQTLCLNKILINKVLVEGLIVTEFILKLYSKYIAAFDIMQKSILNSHQGFLYLPEVQGGTGAH